MVLTSLQWERDQDEKGVAPRAADSGQFSYSTVSPVPRQEQSGRGQGNRIYSCDAEDGQGVVSLVATLGTFSFDAHLGGLLVFQKHQGDSTYTGDVLGGILHAEAAVVLPERYIQRPMELILHPPMIPRHRRDPMGIPRGQRTDDIGGLPADGFADRSLSLNFRNAPKPVPTEKSIRD